MCKVKVSVNGITITSEQKLSKLKVDNIDIKNFVADVDKVINNSLDKGYDDDFLKRYVIDQCKKLMGKFNE